MTVSAGVRHAGFLCAHQGPGASPAKSSNVNRHALSALSMETAVDILSQLYRSGPALFCVARKTHCAT